MTPAAAGRKGASVRTIMHSAAVRREWASRGGRVSAGLEALDGVPVAVLVNGHLVLLADMDASQRKAHASLRGRELAAKRWSKKGDPDG